MTVSTAIVETLPKSKRGAVESRPNKATTKRLRKFGSTPSTPTAVEVASQADARVTKQARVLTLLSQQDGASIAEMMQATEWQ